MNAFIFWNNSLLLAALIVVIGVTGIAAADRSEQRWLSGGLFLQGVILTFAAGAGFYAGSVDLRLGGIAVTGLLIMLHMILPDNQDDPVMDESQSA